ncbi:MAG TPA: hypothetical protein VIH57_22580 [Bacteroidales bacterium]
MKYVEILHMIERIDALIQHHATGTPAELCERLKISKSTWHELKKTMIDDLHFPIAYSKYRQTYYYTEDGRFEPGRFNPN